MPAIEPDVIRHALDVARSHGIAEIEIEQDDETFSATLQQVKPKPKQATQVAEPTSEEPGTPLPAPIKAALVGYYQASKEPLAAGKKVEKGQAVAVIEALGVATDVIAPVSGEVVEALVSNGDAVEYGQVLAYIREVE